MGVSPTSIYFVPKEVRGAYLSRNENQNIGEEKMWCVTAAFHNWAENELTSAYNNSLLSKDDEAWLEGAGYINEDGQIELSDSFVAIGSGTTREGNSLKAPIDWARKNGMIPKKLLPQLHGFDETYDLSRVTDEMRDLAKEFARRFPFAYEQVQELQFSLNDDGCIVAVYAWPHPINGVYPRVENDPNHGVYRMVKFINHAVPDTYETAGTFMKNLASNYNFMDAGYRCYFVPAEKKTKSEGGLKAWIKNFLCWT